MTQHFYLITLCVKWMSQPEYFSFDQIRVQLGEICVVFVLFFSCLSALCHCIQNLQNACVLISILHGLCDNTDMCAQALSATLSLGCGISRLLEREASSECSQTGPAAFVFVPNGAHIHIFLHANGLAVDGCLIVSAFWSQERLGGGKDLFPVWTLLK